MKVNVQFGSQKLNVFELLNVKFFSIKALTNIMRSVVFLWHFFPKANESLKDLFYFDFRTTCRQP